MSELTSPSMRESKENFHPSTEVGKVREYFLGLYETVRSLQLDDNWGYTARQTKHIKESRTASVSRHDMDDSGKLENFASIKIRRNNLSRKSPKITSVVARYGLRDTKGKTLGEEIEFNFVNASGGTMYVNYEGQEYRVTTRDVGIPFPDEIKSALRHVDTIAEYAIIYSDNQFPSYWQQQEYDALEKDLLES